MLITSLGSSVCEWSNNYFSVIYVTKMAYDQNINQKISAAFYVGFAVTKQNSKSPQNKCTPMSQNGGQYWVYPIKYTTVPNTQKIHPLGLASSCRDNTIRTHITSIARPTIKNHRSSSRNRNLEGWKSHFCAFHTLLFPSDISSKQEAYEEERLVQGIILWFHCGERVLDVTSPTFAFWWIEDREY